MAKSLFCPSAQPDIAGAQAFAIRDPDSDTPQIAFLDAPVQVTPEVLISIAPAAPMEVFRFAAPCQEHACSHFDGRNCSLVERIVRILPAVTSDLSRCMVRSTCRWFAQEGKAACARCPQVITLAYHPSEDVVAAATPVSAQS